MKNFARLFFCVIAALGFVVGCGEDSAAINTDGGPCPLQQGLVGGVPDETHKAVLAMFGNDEGCSGTLIAPRRFVTAAHCCMQSGWRFTVSTTPEGRSEDRPNDFATVMGTAFVHPKYKFGELSPYDLCIIALDQPLDIEPIVIAKSAPALEAQVTIVGFGKNRINDCNGAEIGYGIRRQGNVVVTNATDEILETHSSPGDPVVVIWHGDSGGALLFRGDDGIERLVGVTRSFQSNIGVSAFINAAANRDWIIGTSTVDAGTIADGDVALDAGTSD